jgi:ubiquinone/menaquinone biosynthesis C-methylase UbiE
MELETLNCCNLCGSKQLEVLDAASNLCGCQSCGYVFDNPRPTADEVKRFYSKATKYDVWVRDEKARDVLWKRRLRKLEKSKKPGSLLDVGTGIAQFLYHAKAAYSHVYGTEVSDSAIEIAKEKYGLTVMKGQVEDLQFGENRFDNITLFHVLEHVPNPKSVIERCRELLTPEGELVVAVPNDILTLRGKRNKLRVLQERVVAGRSQPRGNLGLPRITLDGSSDEIHVSHFTPNVLQRFLEASGFSVLENSLDPFYVASGIRKLREDLLYTGCSLLKVLLGLNVYDTIWIAAKKT